MKNFKLKLSTLTLGLISINVSAQQLPTNTSPSGVVPSGQNNQQFWSRAGNSPFGGSNNIFGTNFNSPVYHYTTGKNRMILFDDTWNTAGAGLAGTGTPFGGGLAINANPLTPISRPWSLLTIGENSTVAAGWRNWMSVGTFYNMGSDNMYVGLKNEMSLAGDRQDAVISWGDNTSIGGSVYGPDYLRFIFTAPNLDPSYPAYQKSQDGLEVMRMNWEGKAGVGNYFNNVVESPFSKDPARRFEILSDKTSAGANGNPTFRMTHTQQNPGALLTTGKYSEFEDRSTGDLFINTRNNTLVTTATRDFKQRYIGINTNTPGNTLEINSQYSNALTPNGFGGTGWAGVRFTDLRSTSVAQPNPSANVLSVNTNGDVILVPGGTTGLGNLCGSPTPNPLLNNWQVPLNNHNVYFTSDLINSDKVYIGSNCSTVKSGKLNVTTAVNTNPINPTESIAVLVENNNTPTSNNYGINTSAISAASPIFKQYGIKSFAQGGREAIGIRSEAVQLTGSNAAIAGDFQAGGVVGVVPVSNFLNIGIRCGAGNGNTNLGVSGHAVAGVTSYGGFFTAGGASLTNIGIYASAPSSPTDWAGYFNEKVFINGAGISSAGLIFSDQNIKNNVATVSKPLDLLLKLRPVSYNLNNAFAPQLNVDTAKTFGLIAQEVALVIPELVKDVIVPAKLDSLGSVTTPSVTLKSLNYNGLIPLTISAIQDINSRQNVMQEQLNKAGLSDALVKTNINNFNALAKIKTLNPVSYNFTNVSVPQLTFTTNLDYGFIAQQLQTVYPELVDTLRIPAKYDSLGAIVNVSQVLKTVNYKAMNALLTRAVQEQQFKIDSLFHVASKQDSINNAIQTQISNLTSMINACCSNPGAKTSNPSINQLDVELSDKDAIVLNQNVPNPFAEQTTITYNVPASVTKAQLLFFNANGQVIQTVDIKTRGKGKVNVFASDLSSGLYHYTLVADGKVVDSKKMVRE